MRRFFPTQRGRWFFSGGTGPPLGLGWTNTILLLLFLQLGSGRMLAMEAPPTGVPRFRFSLALSMRRDGREKDVKASMTVWLETLANKRDLLFDSGVGVFTARTAAGEALRKAPRPPALDQ